MKPLLRTLAASACLLALGACTESAGPGARSNLTQILLTDAPFPFDDVRSVEIYVVSVAVSPGGDTLAPDWRTVAEPRKRFDLLKVQNGATALLGETELEAGLYRMMRFVINTDSSAITWADGRKATVHWGSAGEIAIHPMVEQPLGISPEGGRIVIDFDVGRSFPFNVIPSAEFDFLPWIRAVETSEAGTS